MSIPSSLTSPKHKGNYKAGPGRPPGSKNKRTLALEEASRQAVAKIDDAFEGDAHAFLQAVYKNPNVPLETRIMAASRALRVEKPVLSAIQGRMDVNINLADRLQAARERVQAISNNKNMNVIRSLTQSQMPEEY